MSIKPEPTFDCDLELDETMLFFGFSYIRTNPFAGTACFELEYPDGRIAKRIVRVLPGRGVIVENEETSAHKVSLRVSMKRDMFFLIYMNKIQASTAIMSGKMKVHNWAYGELRRFSEVFDSRTEVWNKFYAERERLGPDAHWFFDPSTVDPDDDPYIDLSLPTPQLFRKYALPASPPRKRTRRNLQLPAIDTTESTNLATYASGFALLSMLNPGWVRAQTMCGVQQLLPRVHASLLAGMALPHFPLNFDDPDASPDQDSTAAPTLPSVRVSPEPLAAVDDAGASTLPVSGSGAFTPGPQSPGAAAPHTLGSVPLVDPALLAPLGVDLHPSALTAHVNSDVLALYKELPAAALTPDAVLHDIITLSHSDPLFRRNWRFGRRARRAEALIEPTVSISLPRHVRPAPLCVNGMEQSVSKVREIIVRKPKVKQAMAQVKQAKAKVSSGVDQVIQLVDNTPQGSKLLSSAQQMKTDLVQHLRRAEQVLDRGLFTFATAFRRFVRGSPQPVSDAHLQYAYWE